MIDLTTFFSNLGIVGGSATASNQYEFYYGIQWSDGSTTYNQFDFYTKLGGRYQFFQQYINEYNFYTGGFNDANIVDYKTFYEYAGAYLGAAPAQTGTFLAFSDGGNVYSSTDGDNWTDLGAVGSSTITACLAAEEYGINFNFGTIQSRTSPFTSPTSASVLLGYEPGVGYSPLLNRAVAFTYYNTKPYYSNDNGVNWSEGPTHSFLYNPAITWNSNNNLFYAIVWAAGQSGILSSTSADGLTWSTPVATSGIGNYWASSNYIYVSRLGLFICAQNYIQNVCYSSDNITWTAVSGTSNPSGRWFEIKDDGTNIVIVGDNGTFLTSTDGINWTFVYSPNYIVGGGPNNFVGLAYGNGTFVATQNNNEPYVYSVDGGATWATASFSGSAFSVITFVPNA